MNTLPPLNALRAFESAARLGVKKAGEELCVTHGAVSRQLKQLESWLGVALFERNHRALSATRRGREYQQSVAAAFNLIMEATQSVKNRRPANVLSIATTHSVASKWLMGILPFFADEHPEIEVWLTLDQQLTDFTQSDSDVALRMGKGPWPKLHCVPLMCDRLITVCSPELFEQGPKLTSPCDLAHHTLLHDQDPRTRWQFWLEAQGVTNVDATLGPRYTSLDVLLNAAVSGQGIALASEVLATNDLTNGRLVQALPQAVDLGTNFWLVLPDRSRSIPNVKKFCKWIEQTTKSGSVRVL